MTITPRTPAGGTRRVPNILWISTHDINPDLGSYRGIWPGADDAITPNLDALAAEGVRFDNAFATTPVCAPSRSAIMTGCFPTSIGTHNMRSKAVPPPEVRLLSEYFRQAGFWVTNNAFTDLQVPVPGTAFDECSPTAHWRNRPTEETPFFASFHGLITHESQVYLPDKRFAEATATLSEAQRHDPATVNVPPYHPDDEVFRQAWSRYHDLVTVMDAWVGDVLRELDDDGLAEDTIVVFWSDHGAGFPRAKRWASEAGLRVPLIVRWPARLAGGSVRSDIVHVADLAPTMLRMCGLDVPGHMQMQPLFDERGDDLAHGEYAFGARDRMDDQHDSSRTVRDRRYRYVRHAHPDRPPMQSLEYAEHFSTWQELRRRVNEEARGLALGEATHVLTDLQRQVVGPSKPDHELYDLVNDPHETCDLAADEAHRDVLERLADALELWQDRVGDLGRTPEAELVRAWRPDGTIRITDPVGVVIDGDRVVLSCPTEGALIAWTEDPPPVTLPVRGPMAEVLGDPEQDGRHWTIYSGTLATSDRPRWARAWRLGYLGGPDVVIATSA